MWSICKALSTTKHGLAGTSVFEAEGLLREHGDYPGAWNVVIGNPEGQGLAEVGDDFYDGYHRRNNPLRREFGGVLQLGRKQIPGVALLARVPNRYIDAACEVRPNMPIGDARHIEETYRQMAVDPTCEAWLLNPTLLIDFVDGGTGRIFPQVSFYWHGHSQESFFRAVVSPNRPNVIAPVVEFLNEHGYASLVSLYHHFAEQLGNVKYEDFREELNTACAQANPSMALVEEGEADRAWLTHTVYYSTAWMANQEHPSNLSNGEVIGRDLFRKIVGNHWNWFTKPWGATQIQPTNHAPNNGIGYLSYTLVDQAGYGKVMSYDFVRDVYNWMSFAQHYRTIE